MNELLYYLRACIPSGYAGGCTLCTLTGSWGGSGTSLMSDRLKISLAIQYSTGRYYLASHLVSRAHETTSQRRPTYWSLMHSI